jgi:hypothetical protein
MDVIWAEGNVGDRTRERQETGVGSDAISQMKSVPNEFCCSGDGGRAGDVTVPFELGLD